MVFRAPFSSTFVPPFGGGAVAAAVPWYLSGGVTSANCLAAYLAKTAADLAASYVNLANVGTYTLGGYNPSSFDTLTGWGYDGTLNHYQTIGNGGFVLKPATIIARVTPAVAGVGSFRFICGGAAYSGELTLSIVGDGRLYLSTQYANNIVLTTDTISTTDVVIAATYSAAGVGVVYIDGVAKKTATNNVTVNQVTNRIGAAFTTSNPFIGIMAGISFYNTDLTAAQVAAISAALKAK